MPKLNIARLARALVSPEMDSRSWLESGTIGLLGDDDELDVESPESIYVDPFGAIVSVRLEPSGRMVTARYNGLGCGQFGSILVPISPGDEVLVGIPNGNYNSPGVQILGLCANATTRIPSDWNNDHVRLTSNLDVQIEAASIRLDAMHLFLNGRRVNPTSEDI